MSTLQTGRKRKRKSPPVNEMDLLTVIANQAAVMHGIAALLSNEPHRHTGLGDILAKQADVVGEYANRKLREREESK